MSPIGPNALFSNTTAINNTATGSSALYYNTTGHDNVANGRVALGSNTAGSHNIATGTSALYANTTGNQNSAAGSSALRANTSGSDNIADGFQAMFANTAGYQNVAGGTQVLRTNTTGYRNGASGYRTLYKNTTGHDNQAFGFQALINNTTGNSNIALGSSAGANLTTGSNNVAIASAGVAAETGKIRIGTTGTQNAAFIAGINNTSITGPTKTVLVNASGQLGTATASSAGLKTDIKPLASQATRLLDLRPVSYRYTHGDRSVQFGLLAEQVARTLPELVQFDAGGKPTGVHYDQLPALLLAELQRQAARAERQDRTLRRQAEQIRALRKAVLGRP